MSQSNIPWCIGKTKINFKPGMSQKCHAVFRGQSSEWNVDPEVANTLVAFEVAETIPPLRQASKQLFLIVSCYQSSFRESSLSVHFSSGRSLRSSQPVAS